MTRSVLAAMMLLAATGAAPLPAATAPTPEAAIQRAMAAAGGRDTFTKLGTLKLTITGQEIKSSGEIVQMNEVAYLDTSDPSHLRLEFPEQAVVIGMRGGPFGWATIAGVPDKRPATRLHSVRTLRASIIPLLAPFSMSLSGLKASAIEATVWEGAPALAITVDVPKNFFGNPLMDVPWTFIQEQKSGRLVAWQFLPPEEYASVLAEGMRYIPQVWTTVGGVQLPTKLLVEGHTPDGKTTNHSRTMTISYEVQAPQSDLFLPPQVGEALGTGEPVHQP